MNKQTDERNARELDFTRLLREERFDFYLQPKVDLLSGEIVGAEALARLILPDGEVVFPDSFVPQMERDGSIVEMDFLILKKVCSHLNDRLRQEHHPVPIAVNLSRLHLEHDDTFARIRLLLDEYAVPPALLEFELTETLFLEDYTRARALIDALRFRGHKISIDDFGSGYAGINLWRELKFDTVKLDKCFLSDKNDSNGNDIDNATLLPEIISTAKRMNNTVICEGAETEEDCRTLLKYGCHLVQGYYFSKPVPKAEFYETFTERGGYFDTPYLKHEQDNADLPPVYKTRDKLRHRFTVAALLLIFIQFAIFFPVSYTVQTRINVERHRSSLDDGIRNSLAAHVELTELRMEDIRNILESFASLMEKNRSTADVDTYLVSMSEVNRNISFLYFTLAQMDARVESGELNPSDLELLRQKKPVTSAFYPRPDGGTDSYFAIAVPVFIDGTLAGALHASINANMFLAAESAFATYGSIPETFLADPDGTVLYCRCGNHAGMKIEDAVAAVLAGKTVRMREVREAVTERAVTCFTAENSGTYFCAVSPYRNMNCSVVILLDTAKNTAFISSVTRISVVNALVILTAMTLVFLVFLILVFRNEEKYRNAAYRWEILEHFSDTAIFIYTAKDDSLELTPNSRKLCRLKSVKIKGFLAKNNASGIIYPTDFKLLLQTIHAENNPHYSEIRLRLQHPTEDKYNWCLIQLRFLYEKNRLASVIGKIVEIDRIQRAENTYRVQAQHDGLTGLLNKATFERRVEKMICEDEKGILLMIDVNAFKSVNDTFGHLIGDEILKSVSGCLGETFTEELVGRIGGDEFAVYISEKGDGEYAESKLKLLDEKLNDLPEEKSGRKISISIGISTRPADGNSYLQLFRKADEEMYRAKKSGKTADGYYVIHRAP